MNKFDTLQKTESLPDKLIVYTESLPKDGNTAFWHHVRLKFDNTSGILGLPFALIVCVIMAITSPIAYFQKTTLFCERTTENGDAFCEFNYASLLRQKRINYNDDEKPLLVSARAKAFDNEEKTCTVYLRNRQGEETVFSNTLKKDKCPTMVKDINQFLKSKQTGELTIRPDNSIWTLLIAAICSGFAIFITLSFLTYSDYAWVFDKKTRHWVRYQLNLINKRTITHPFEEIDEIKMRRLVDDEDDYEYFRLTFSKLNEDGSLFKYESKDEQTSKTLKRQIEAILKE